jgi:hypothetical protein
LSAISFDRQSEFEKEVGGYFRDGEEQRNRSGRYREQVVSAFIGPFGKTLAKWW